MRKTRTVVISEEGRDRGKTFLLREMPALRAEKWAYRALMAIGMEEMAAAGMGGVAGVAAAGFQVLQSGKLRFDDVEPLLDEMMECVQIIPKPSQPDVVRPLVLDGDGADIDEILTLMRLRKEVFDLHTEFFTQGERQTSEPASAPVSQGS